MLVWLLPLLRGKPCGGSKKVNGAGAAPAIEREGALHGAARRRTAQVRLLPLRGGGTSAVGQQGGERGRKRRQTVWGKAPTQSAIIHHRLPLQHQGMPATQLPGSHLSHAAKGPGQRVPRRKGRGQGAYWPRRMARGGPAEEEHWR